MFGLTESNDKAKCNLTLVVEEIISGKTLFYFCFYDLVKSCHREKVLEEKRVAGYFILARQNIFGTAN